VTRIALIAHAPLASAWASCATHILGAPAQLDCVDIAPDMDSDATVAALMQQLRPDAQHNGLLILSDVFGATPFNIARRVVQQLQTQGQAAVLLSGTNLCMLLKALTLPEDNVRLLAGQVLQSGRKGMVQAEAQNNVAADTPLALCC